MAKRNAQGAGSIRKKTVIRNGKEYSYWEARVTIGRDPGTGKQIQKSITGKTQAEVRKKLQRTAVAVEDKTYKEPVRLTVSQWFDIWTDNYLTGRKLSTISNYKLYIKNHIKPSLGTVRLPDLTKYQVQIMVNNMDCNPSTIRSVFKILHAGLEKAVDLGYLQKNPSDKTELPRVKKTEIRPFSDDEARKLIEAVKGTEIENMVKLSLLTGMRESEILGLTWDCINREAGTITIDKQLNHPRFYDNGIFVSPKSGKSRVISPAPAAFRILDAERLQQMKRKLKAGEIWDNANNLVFTGEVGEIFKQARLARLFRIQCDKAGLPGFRFHDLRHTYAVNAIRAGDDIKTIQETLGHSSAAFTLDKYAHYTQEMRKASAERMESFAASFLQI